MSLRMSPRMKQSQIKKVEIASANRHRNDSLMIHLINKNTLLVATRDNIRLQ